MRSNVSTLPICGEQLRAAHGCAVTEQAVHISDSSGIYPLLISSSSFLPSILFGSVRRDHDADSCCVSTLYILKFSENELVCTFWSSPLTVPLASSSFLPLPLSLLSLLFFVFSSNLLFHISTTAPWIFYKSVLCCCFCNCNLPFCLFLLFSFSFHFYSLLLVLLSHACAQSWLKIFCFQTDVLWQHLKRAGDLGQWATHVSCIHPALGGYLLLFCFSWSVYHKLCKLSRQGDRQPVQVFSWNRQESQESHWCSGHVRRSTANTLPAFPSPTSSSHLMWSSLIHLPPNCFSSLLALLESWGAHKISLAALEDFSQCWFPKNDELTLVQAIT